MGKTREERGKLHFEYTHSEYRWDTPNTNLFRAHLIKLQLVGADSTKDRKDRYDRFRTSSFTHGIQFA